MSIFGLQKTNINFRGKPEEVWFLDCENRSLAETIKMNFDELNRIMLKDFVGHYWNADSYIFLNEDNARRALEWLEAQYVIVKLTNGIEENKISFTVLKNRFQ